MICLILGCPGDSDGKECACNAGDSGSLPGWVRSPGEGNGSPLQYSCLGNPMDRGAWWATVHGVGEESDMTERLSTQAMLLCAFYLPSALLCALFQGMPSKLAEI